MNRENRRQFLALLIISTLLMFLSVGCAGVNLINKTPEVFDQGKDSPYQFKLQVAPSNGEVDTSTIAAYVYLGGTWNAMSGSGFGDWIFDSDARCPNNFDYSFKVNYTPTSSLTKSGPARLSGLHTDVLGQGSLHWWSPYRDEEPTYPFTGFPVFHRITVFDPPGTGSVLPPNSFIYDIVLRNLNSAADLHLSLIKIDLCCGSSPPPVSGIFALIGASGDGTTLPVSADLSCEDTFTFQLKYIPGWNQNFTTRRDTAVIKVYTRVGSSYHVTAEILLDIGMLENPP